MIIDKLVGDEVTALFIPGFAGKEHARRAVEAGQALLRVTGHGEPGGPWVPVGTPPPLSQFAVWGYNPPCRLSDPPGGAPTRRLKFQVQSDIDNKI